MKDCCFSGSLWEQLDSIVQPVKQRVIGFGQSKSSLDGLKKAKKLKEYRCQETNWRPYLGMKKTANNPKFVVSIEKKKTKNNLCIRNDPISQKYHEPTKGSLSGSKFKSHKTNQHLDKSIPHNLLQQALTQRGPVVGRFFSQNSQKIQRLHLSCKLMKDTSRQQSQISSKEMNTARNTRRSLILKKNDSLKNPMFLTHKLLDSQDFEAPHEKWRMNIPQGIKYSSHRKSRNID